MFSLSLQRFEIMIPNAFTNFCKLCFHQVYNSLQRFEIIFPNTFTNYLQTIFQTFLQTICELCFRQVYKEFTKSLQRVYKDNITNDIMFNIIANHLFTPVIHICICLYLISTLYHYCCNYRYTIVIESVNILFIPDAF